MRKKKHWIVFGGAFAAWILGVLPAAAHGPTGANPSEDFIQTFALVFLMGIPIYLLIQGLVIYAVVRYRRRQGDEMPPQVEGNRTLEWTWTLGSFALVGVLFVVNVAMVVGDSEPPLDAMPIEVTGYQYFWEFYYPETGVRLVGEAKVPAGRNVRLDITSGDVQHAFWVPEWGGKLDAIPGRVNTMWFDLHEPGEYVVRCAEFCGESHYEMLANIEVVESRAFDVWMNRQMAQREAPIGNDMESPLPAGDALNGQDLFNSLGCAACHGEANTSAGPTLDGIGAKAQSHTEDYGSPEAFLRESILMPCAYVYEGYSCTMPDVFGEQLSTQQLADLIAYLMKK